MYLELSQLKFPPNFSIQTFESRYGTVVDQEKNLNLQTLATRIHHFDFGRTLGSQNLVLMTTIDSNHQQIPYLVDVDKYQETLGLKERVVFWVKFRSGNYYRHLQDVVLDQLERVQQIHNQLWDNTLDSKRPFHDLLNRFRRIKRLQVERSVWTNGLEITLKTCVDKMSFLKKIGLQNYFLKIEDDENSPDKSLFGLYGVENFAKRKKVELASFVLDEHPFVMEGFLSDLALTRFALIRLEVRSLANPNVIASMEITKQTFCENYLHVRLIDIFFKDSPHQKRLIEKFVQVAVEILQRESVGYLQIYSFDHATASILSASGFKSLKDAGEVDHESNDEQLWLLYKKCSSDGRARFYKDRYGNQESFVTYQSLQIPTTWNEYLKNQAMLSLEQAPIFD